MPIFASLGLYITEIGLSTVRSINNIIYFKKAERQIKHVRTYTLPDQQAKELGLFLIGVFIEYRLL